ncbi:MAG TPA: hypothetical protein VIL54_04390 [Natronosporangium sp.]
MTFEEYAARHPPALAVLAGIREAARGHRRRTAVTLATAAATVATVVTMPTVPAGRSAPEPEPAPAPPALTQPAASPSEAWPELRISETPRPPYAFTVRPGLVGGYRIWQLAVAPGVQTMAVYRVGDQEPIGHLAVYDPEAMVSMGGGALVHRWEYQPGGFAEIFSESELLDEESARRLADQLRFTSPYQVTVPYRLDYLPPGLTAFNVVADTWPPELRSVVQFERTDTEAVVFDITVGAGPNQVDDPDWDWRPTTIGGRPVEYADLRDGRRYRIEFDGFTVGIGTASLDPDELARIVTGLHPLPSWQEPSTWYEFDDAIPID